MSVQQFGQEFWLHNGSQLTKIVELLGVKLPNPARDAYRDTTQDTTGGVHVYKGQPLLEPGTFTVTINYLQGSGTDTLLIDALADTDPRAYKLVFPIDDDDQEFGNIQGEAILLSYEVGELAFEGKQEAVLTFQGSGANTKDEGS